MKSARICPCCGEKSLRVYDVREIVPGKNYRKIKCIKCSQEFESIEILSKIEKGDK